MSAQDRTEDALRAMHILIANAEFEPGSNSKIIIDKDEAQTLLRELGDCLYAMLDESELSKSSRQQAERSQQKQADLTEERARKKAEDIYAGSLMYSDHALDLISDIVTKATEKIDKIHSDMMEQIEEEKKKIKTNQYELKGQLSDLKDTQEYLRLIEEENKRLEKEQKSGEFTEEADEPSYANIKPEIHVNPAFFQGGDIPAGTVADGVGSDDTGDLSEKIEKQINLDDLDREYFDWKNNGDSDTESEPKKRGLFGVFKK
ncbi:MAG: hypothetical protein DUD27_02930 [Lachnospiraceae bacterium]|uniref:ATP synthase F0 subunit B n=1 Tax=Candidatus Weimeria bifida TaxID=2599074 RepID=A0A6N7J0Q2_9FIRM|nr:ATP synthase F0 subunit B [Candidatus Weimeria bifida]RRF96870.1 MAG: hypothetical protein DUD27_02930 [Lachnospiraceae bacterium]